MWYTGGATGEGLVEVHFLTSPGEFGGWGDADRVGAPRTVMITGAVCLAGTVWFRTQLQE